MKKLLLILSLLFLLTGANSHAQDIVVKLNGTKLNFDQSPVVSDGRTLVPMRAIFEALDCLVDWNGDTGEITATKDEKIIVLTLGMTEVRINSDTYTLDVPPQIVNNRTLVPVRFIAESLDCDVKWLQDTSTVIINRLHEPTYEISGQKNLYNPIGNTSGKYMGTTGLPYGNPSYFYTSVIEVPDVDVLYFTLNRSPYKVRFVTAFDANMNVLSDSGAENVSEIKTDGVKYIVVTALETAAQHLVISTSNDADVIIPSEICAVVGKTISIYNKNLISKDYNNYKFEWQCDIGNAMDDKFQITASDADIGIHELSLTVRNSADTAIFTGKTKLNIVASSAESASVLAIGDSLTNNKPWLSSVANYSGKKIEFVGTRGIAPYYHEGRSGFNANNYLSASKYDFEKEGVHSFWDGERFNWNHYKTETGVTPDAVQIFLGTNGLTANPVNNAKNILRMVDYIRQDDTDIPIFIVNTMYRGPIYDANGTIDTKTTDEQHINIFNLTEYLTYILKEHKNVYMVPAYAVHDSDSNYSVNDSIHPQNEGYEQIADIVYSTYCAHLK